MIANNAALIQRLIQQIQELEEELDELGNEEQVEIEFEFDSGFAEEFSLENIQNWTHTDSTDSQV